MIIIIIFETKINIVNKSFKKNMTQIFEIKSKFFIEFSDIINIIILQILLKIYQ